MMSFPSPCQPMTTACVLPSPKVYYSQMILTCYVIAGIQTYTDSTYVLTHAHTHIRTYTYTSAKLPLHPMAPTPFYARLPAKKSGALIRVINLETATFTFESTTKNNIARR